MPQAKTPRPVVPAGLAVVKWAGGWYIKHTATKLPLHQGYYRLKTAATAAAASLTDLDFDWDVDLATFRATATEDLRREVQRRVLPPEVRERRRRSAVNGTRYLEALKADGQTVGEPTSHGMAGTSYPISCGCVRIYALDTSFGQVSENDDLAVRCERHRDLRVPKLDLDDRAIREDMRRAGIPG